MANSVKRMSLSAQKAVDFYLDASQEMLESDAQNKALRMNGQTHLVQQGFPSRRDEDWQYTPLNKFLQQSFSASSAGQISAEQLAKFLPPFDVMSLVFVDGYLQADVSSALQESPKGFTLQTGVQPYQGKVSESLRQQTENEPFAHLNAMMFTDGFSVDIAANAILEKPLFVLHVQTQTEQACQLRNEISIGKNAHFSLIERSVSLVEGADLVNFYTEISLAEDANFNQVCLQEENQQCYHFANQLVEQAKNSVFSTLNVALGGVVSRQQNYVALIGEYAESSQNSIVFGQNEQVLDSRTDTQHLAPNCPSQQLHKFVLKDKARGVFNGMIKVDQIAQKTDGQMDNKNLLLSENAKMDVKPQLEIYADDVKCSHGSASGQIDEEQVFYLQSRGIRRPQAIQLITEAFLLEPLEDISNDALRRWLTDIVTSRLQTEGI